ncbi:MAG: RteC domain-containing protein [Rikenellaceae bacterium]
MQFLEVPYRYYKAKSVRLDEFYFTRKHVDFYDDWKEVSFERNIDFSTSHDLDIAKFISYELLLSYIANQIDKTNVELNIFNEECDDDALDMVWTDKKSDIIELCYALYAKGSINRGQVSIKDLISKMEQVFHVNSGNYYHVYSSFKDRKKEQVQFISALSKALKKKIDNEESGT